MKSKVFAYVYPAISELLNVHSSPDDIRTLSPYRADGHFIQRRRQVFTEQVLPFSHQLLFAKLW